MRQRLHLLGLAVVALAAAILSFATLRDLALTAGYSPRLAWLLPVAIDAGALIGAIVWLAGDHSEHARKLGRRITRALLLLSVALNAVQHAITSPPSAWLGVVLVVIVSAVAPAVLGAAAHLAVVAERKAVPPPPPLNSKAEEPPEEDADRPVVTPPEVIESVSEAVGLPFTALTPSRTTCHVYRLYDSADDLLYVGVGYDVAERARQHKRKKPWWSEVVQGSITTYPTRRDALLAEMRAIASEGPRHNVMPGGGFDHAAPWSEEEDPNAWTRSDPVAVRENVPAAELHAPSRGGDMTSDDTLADRVVRWAAEEGSMPSRERVRLRFNIGSKRAERIRGLAVEMQESARSAPGPDPADSALTSGQESTA